MQKPTETIIAAYIHKNTIGKQIFNKVYVISMLKESDYSAQKSTVCAALPIP